MWPLGSLKYNWITQYCRGRKMLILLEFKELALENPTYLHENKFCWDIWFTLVWIGLYKGFIVLGAEKKAKSMWTFNAKSWPCKLYGAAQQ